MKLANLAKAFAMKPEAACINTTMPEDGWRDGETREVRRLGPEDNTVVMTTVNNIIHGADADANAETLTLKLLWVTGMLVVVVLVVTPL